MNPDTLSSANLHDGPASQSGGLNRRGFLRGLVGAGMAGGPLAGVFGPLSAMASKGADEGGRILLVIHQAGGNDSLNTVVPYETNDSGFYYAERPRLALQERDILPLQDGLGLHSNLYHLKSLWDDGDLAIVNGVGNPIPTLSHFKSIDVWESSVPTGFDESGWLGRYLTHRCASADGFDSLSGVEAVGRASLAMRTGELTSPLAVKDPAFFDYLTKGRHTPGSASFDNHFARTLAVQGTRDSTTPSGEVLEYVRSSLEAALNSSKRLQSIIQTGDGGFPSATFSDDPLGTDLKNIARYINGGSPTTVYFAVHGGYDTHAGQYDYDSSGRPLVGRHADLMSGFNGAIGAFATEMKRQGKWDRTLIMTYSEFSRKVNENGNGGTDHGAAGSMFLAGGAVEPGFYGAMPSLAPENRILNNSLAYNTDFRQVYRTVLERWLDLDAEALGTILRADPASFAPLDFLL